MGRISGSHSHLYSEKSLENECWSVDLGQSGISGLKEKYNCSISDFTRFIGPDQIKRFAPGEPSGIWMPFSVYIRDDIFNPKNPLNLFMRSTSIHG